MTTPEMKFEPKEVIEKQMESVTRSYQHYLNNPFEAKHVHDLRINIRQARALLNFLKPSLETPVYEANQTAFREAGRVLSPLRDLDVLIAFCGTFARSNPELSEDYRDLFNYLGILRRREERKTFNKTNRQHFIKMLESCQQLISDDLSLDFKNWPKYVDKRLAKKQTKLENLVAQIEDADYEGMHHTRKQAKKLRYAAMLLKKSPHQKSKQAIKYAKGIQTDLGEKTDAYVINQLLTEISQKAPEQKLQKLLGVIQKQVNEA